MALVSIVDLSLSFGHPPLVEGGNAQIEEGDRVVLLGRNGCGKSTLLSCLAGEHEPDAGALHWTPGVTRGFLPQEVPAGLRGSVYRIVSGALAEEAALLADYHVAAQDVAKDPTPQALARLARAEEAVEMAGAWALHERVARAIADLDLDGDATFETLSGGQKRRVLLARSLAGEPDLLLLDEPTNHLDIDTIQRLEERLLAYNGTLIIVTHDRALARSLATRVLDIDRGRLTAWPCDFETYQRRKEEALAVEEAEQERFDQKLAREEIWVRQGIKARRTRNEGRVRALERMREQRAVRRGAVGHARVRLQTAGRTGSMVIEAHDLSFQWKEMDVEAGKHPLLKNFTTRIVRGDRIGLLGPNGSGKTTLLRLLLGNLEPTSGSVRHGTRMEVVYYDQLRAELDDERTVLDTVADGKDMITFEGRPIHVHPYLAGFLFTRDRMEQPVSALSGGERNRLVLARLFTKPCNVLVMDEPTNDLDVETLEILERVLIDFPGTLLLVSHDREFLDNVVTSTMVMEGKGQVTEYAGGYTEWLTQRPPPPPVPPPAGRPSGPISPAGGPSRKRSKPRKLTYNETRELATLEPRIEALEAEKESLHASMADPAFYQADPDAVATATRRLPALETELEQTYARWEELETIREEISTRQNP